MEIERGIEIYRYTAPALSARAERLIRAGLSQVLIERERER